MKRIDGRAYNQLRPVSIQTGSQIFAEGSALIEAGSTRVLCAVTMEDRVPAFMKGQGTGWITAEYAMLPRATLTRTPRRTSSDGPAGRSLEIQRLIGRSLRAVTDLTAIGERTFTVDCDVLQADGGTRTAAITGAYVALYQAFYRLKELGILAQLPFTSMVAATSVGVVDREQLLDLCYQEDFAASVDFNVVMTDKDHFVELQGTAEGRPFSRDTADSLITLAEEGIRQLFTIQKEAIAQFS